MISYLLFEFSFIECLMVSTMKYAHWLLVIADQWDDKMHIRPIFLNLTVIVDSLAYREKDERIINMRQRRKANREKNPGESSGENVDACETQSWLVRR